MPMMIPLQPLCGSTKKFLEEAFIYSNLRDTYFSSLMSSILPPSAPMLNSKLSAPGEPPSFGSKAQKALPLGERTASVVRMKCSYSLRKDKDRFALVQRAIFTWCAECYALIENMQLKSLQSSCDGFYSSPVPPVPTAKSLTPAPAAGPSSRQQRTLMSNLLSSNNQKSIMKRYAFVQAKWNKPMRRFLTN